MRDLYQYLICWVIYDQFNPASRLWQY